MSNVVPLHEQRVPWWWKYRVDVPEGACQGMKVERFEVPKVSLQALRLEIQGRGVPPGWYTRLVEKSTLWMSDTPAEIRDHREAIDRICHAGGRVLVNGLGLGLVVKAALACERVEHVDVVESDERVIKLVAPSYVGPRCTVHHGDAYTFKFPAGSRWSVAWHDVWPEITEDNVPWMTALHRKYGTRVDWQGSWCREQARRMRVADPRDVWRRFRFLP